MKFRIFIIMIGILIVSVCSCGSPCKNGPTALRGVIDLRYWNFDREGPVPLSGEWDFFWQELVQPDEFETNNKNRTAIIMQVPEIWNNNVFSGNHSSGDGCATYRLRILLSDAYNRNCKRVMALFVPEIGTAFSLFVDGVLVGSGGIVSCNALNAKPGYHPDIATMTVKGNEANVVLHVSNYHHRKGGVWKPIIFGTEHDIRALRDRKGMIDFFLMGSIFIMGCYHLVLFSARRKDRSYIYFGLFCLIIASRILVTGEYFILRIAPGISWGFIIAAEYATFYISVPIFYLFMMSIYPDEFSIKVVRLVFLVGLLFCLIVVTTPPSIFTHTILLYQGFSFASGLYCMCALFKALHGKKEGSALFVLGFVFFFGTVVHDFLHNHMVIKTGYLVPVGLFVFIFLQSFLLSLRFSQAFSMIEELTGELKEKNKMLIRHDAMKNKFLQTVSHELMMPLNGMIGLAETMIDGRPEKIGLATKRNLYMIVSSGRRLAGLVNDILDFSRLKNNEIILHRVSLDIKSCVDIVLTVSQPIADHKRILLINRIKSNEFCVYADESRVQQILYNCIDFVIAHTGSNSIMIEAVEQNGAGWIGINISDAPCNISRTVNLLSCQQDNGVPQHMEDGVGIGISIVQYLVQLHGGTMCMEVGKDKRSFIFFTLPLVKNDSTKEKITAYRVPFHSVPIPWEHQESDEMSNSSLRKNGNILVIDDDDLSRQVIQNYLLGELYSVATASHGFDVLGMVQKYSFDVLLLDIMMPGISGYQICAELRKQFSLYDLPVIILTARYTTADCVASFEAGANDYLTKPINRDELLARVRTLVALKRTVQAHAESRFKQLQERMNPHFLFNALNTIHAMIRVNQDAADQAVIKLADNYRFLIEHAGLSLVAFDTEWQFVINYLELEELRFGDLFSFRINKQGDFSGVLLPPLTIQPIVENALKHGLRQLNAHGVVMVSAIYEHERVHINVCDNGLGLRSHDLFSRSLGNIRTRLKYYFQDVIFSIENVSEGGVEVDISFLYSSEKKLRNHTERTCDIWKK